MHVPRHAVDVDIWTTDGRRRLHQVHVEGEDEGCPQYLFYRGLRHRYGAQWDTCGHEITSFGGRNLRVFWWS